MHLLGHHLPEHKALKVALTAFYGVNQAVAKRLLARLSIPEQARVSSLTETQVTALSAYLSSPATSAVPGPTPVTIASGAQAPDAPGKGDRADPLNTLLIETDLRRQRQADILHHRQIGTYRGRRHAMSLPVRGQNTRNNAATAKMLNRVNRKAFS
jgi:small subunit ribosomal protein S13